MKILSALTVLCCCALCGAAEVQQPAADPADNAPAAPSEHQGESAVEIKYILTPTGLPIRQAIVDDTEYNHKKYEAAPEIKYVTIHNTAEPYSAMQERTRVNTRTSSATSFQFAVDEKEAVQILPDQTHGWHAGDGHGEGNMKSIGIEICRSQCIGDDGFLYEGAEANAVKLAAYLLKKYHLTTSDLRMHWDWTGKHCPHRILDAGSWNQFKARVDEALKEEMKADDKAVTVKTFDTAAHDKAGLNIITRDGKTLYSTQYSAEFTEIAPLVADLVKNKIKQLTISSWVSNYDTKPLFDALAAAGIEVEACYVPQAGASEWIRQNLIKKTEK
ncbi:MAG: N-acetylmuramoyl-L-alanine amidase family protein [Victivallaceae bacterium]|nr:N-acetylmuramoyl-L-alanine amidase [Victivallaceae bacterium]